jgi:glycosyltransferase involved in cell wall biosynthesis
VTSPSLAELVASSEIRRVRVLAWRDLDDPEAGGSERHAHEILRRWAQAGLEIEMRTSAIAGQPTNVRRDGYAVYRSGGRYAVFYQSFFQGLMRDRRRFDAVVEIWNGAPFLTPVWARRRSVWLHHVHGEMWRLSLGPILARVGWFVEHRLAPMFYRRDTIATLSPSSAREIEERLHLHHVRVIRPGVDARFRPAGSKSPEPLIVAVGRLVPVKRFDRLIRDVVAVQKSLPDVRLEIVGEGYLRAELQDLIDSLGASQFITLRGFVTDDDVLESYQRAWLVASTSLREGWGMSLTEAAACGTPAVASDIAGHRDAVINHTTGVLVDADASLSSDLLTLLRDHAARESMSVAATALGASLTWDSAAISLFELLAEGSRG